MPWDAADAVHMAMPCLPLDPVPCDVTDGPGAEAPEAPAPPELTVDMDPSHVQKLVGKGATKQFRELLDGSGPAPGMMEGLASWARYTV